ncbi:MAG: septum formation protein Maf [Desulfovibrionaceae bacterium]|nr:septum formation protein Maf [Desulfovibrionaceae bacterium]
MSEQALFALQSNLKLILASASPRRKQFLDEWGITYQICRPQLIEPKPEAFESPTSYTERLAKLKGSVSYASLDPEGKKSTLLISADTVVAFNNEILGKPVDAAHALSMLKTLAGKKHEVTTSVYCIFPDGSDLSFSETSLVFFHQFPEEILQSYVVTGEPLDKAGAYAIQGMGAFLIEKIEGSWSTVVGLPVCRLAQELLSRGLLLAKQPLY